MLAHRHGKLVSIELNGDVYVEIVISAKTGNFRLEIGVNTGRIIKDRSYRPMPGQPRKGQPGQPYSAVKPVNNKPQPGEVNPKKPVESPAPAPGR